MLLQLSLDGGTIPITFAMPMIHSAAQPIRVP